MKRLRYGMVGGGPGSFIGAVHRKAINLELQAELVAGCFSRTLEKGRITAEELGVDPERCYATFAEMAEKEAVRPDGIDFAVIVTPNYAHYDACKAFLERGISVSCDKPLTTTLEQAKELQTLAESKGLLLMVTYGYSAHVTARHIREYIRSGGIGEVRTVMGEYPQGWLAHSDISGNKQAEMRCDPAQAGTTNALGDIGTHIENTVYRMTGLKIRRLLARMDVVVPTRVLDDNSFVMVEYDNGATGMYWASQIAIGHDNSLRIRIYGSEGSLLWFQENPEVIQIVKADGSLTELHRGHGGIAPEAAKYQRLPSGHTEGLIEAMGNLYDSFIRCLRAKEDGSFTPDMVDFPTAEDGVDGLEFVEACLQSSRNGNIWVTL